MTKNYIESVRKTIFNANKLVEECITNVLKGHNITELELACHDEYCYSVVAEVNPNEFVKVTHIRVGNDDKLEMLLDGHDKWRRLMMVDMPFLLDEVEHALELDEVI